MQHGTHSPSQKHRLDPRHHGLSGDITLTLDAPQIYLDNEKKQWKLGELIESLRKAYCGKIGVEYTHINDAAEKAWIQQQIEGSINDVVPKEEKLKNYDRVLWAVNFGEFMTSKFNT